MADLFDEIGGDVFDSISGDVFDQIEGGQAPPTAGVRDVPGIVGRGVVSAELGVAKSLIGTIDAAISIPREEVRKVATPWAPSQFATMDTGLSKKLKEAKRKIQSAQKKFGRRYSGALAWTTRTISEAVPYMANALAAGVVAGPVGAATVGFVVEGDNAYDDAKASNATEEQAQRERVVVGSLNAIIEAIQIGRVMKFAKSGKHSLKNFVKLARTKGLKHAGKELKGWSGEIARLSLEEALEEFSQEGVSLSVPAIFRGEYPRKEDGSPDWLAVGERLGEAALGGAVAGPVLGGAGRMLTGPQTDVVQDTPPGSNVYETESGRVVIETPSDIGDKASQKTELKDGLVIDKETGETLTQVEEGTVSAIQDAPKSVGISNVEVGRQYGLNDKEMYVRLSEAEQRFQELSQKKTTDRDIKEEQELRFLKDSRTNLEALIEWDTTPTKERVGKQRQKPYKSQYAAGHQIPKLLKMSEKDRRAFMKKETGKTSMAKMTPNQAQQYIDAIREHARKRNIKVDVLPAERKFKKPFPVFGTLTPQLYKTKILGVEFMTKPASIGKQNLDLEFSKEARQVDKMERVINTLGEETMATKTKAKLKNVPTKSVTKFAELINEHEEAPDWLTKEEKDVFNYFRNLNRSIITRENEVRAKLGIEPIPYKTGYMRHIVDVMSQEIMDNKYPIPEELKYWTEKHTTMKINNPMEYQRKLGDELDAIFSKDLIKTTKAMLWTGLKEIHLDEPLKFFENQMGLHSEVIPASTRRWAENFIKHVVKSEQTNTDQGLNDWVKESGIGKVINKVLEPFGRRISHKPATNLLGTLGRFQIYGVMGIRPKQLIRNKFQFIQNLSFSTVKNSMKSFFPSKQAKEIMSESLFMKGYLEGSGFEELVGKRQGRLGRLWMAGFRRTALGNASRAMKVVYRDRLELVEDSKYKKFGWADPKRTYTEEKGFLYPSERARIADEMDFCAGAAQYNYIAIAAPEAFKYKAATPVTRLQSWWMNHFFMFHREGAHRFFTGKTREGLRLPWSRRIGWGRYMVVGGVVLNTLGYAGSFAFGAAPEGIPPLAQLITSLYLYLVSDRDQDKVRAKYKFLNALKTFIPGYLAKKDVEALIDSDGDWTKLLFYNKGIFEEEP